MTLKCVRYGQLDLKKLKIPFSCEKVESGLCSIKIEDCARNVE
jgi:hypothetical protein